jgi:hypothetical protein
MAKLLKTNLPLAQGEVTPDVFNNLVRVLEINLGSFDPDNITQLTTAERDTGNFNLGQIIYNTTTTTLQYWDGSTFQDISSLGATNLNITDGSSSIAINLNSETLTLAGGTGIDTSANTNTVTFAIDSTVATLTGSQTLTNKVLTNPQLDGSLSGSAFLDEDNMASDSNSKVASQQSIKAYADTKAVLSGSTNNQITTVTGAHAIQGESNLTFDGSTLALTGSATISGDLTVSGTTTTIDTTNLNVKDKNITLNYASGDTSSNADGAGITIQDAVNSSTDATILWDATNDEFDFSHPINVTGAVKTSASVDISGTAPKITFTDTDTNADSEISAASSAGNIAISADKNDESDNTVIDFKVDGDTRYYIGENGGLYHGTSTQIIDGSRNLLNIGTISSGTITSSQIQTSSGDFTVDSAADIILDADGADVTIKDGGTTSFQFIQAANSEIDVPRGDLTLDVAGDIILDADGADVVFKDGGTTIAKFTNSSSDFVITSDVDDKDIIFKGQDSTSEITALTLDMSDAGAATFHKDVTIGGIKPTAGTGSSSGLLYIHQVPGSTSVYAPEIDLFADLPVSASYTKLGQILFTANDRVSVAQSKRDFAAIRAISTARTDQVTGGTNSADLTFSLLTGTGSSPTERFRITSNGALGLNGTNYGSSGQVLTSNGSGSAVTWEDASGAISSISNFSDNRVLTASGSDTINGEANLTFDGSTLALTGAATVSSTLGVSGVLTANAGVVVDNITIDGTEIDLSSGDLTLDVAGDIVLDADGGDIWFNDGGTTIGVFKNSSSHFFIESTQDNKDMLFRGVDDTSTITALELDMSDAGTAKFNHDIKLVDNGQIHFGSDDDANIYHNGSDLYINEADSGRIFIRSSDEVRINKYTGEFMVRAIADGSVYLYHDNTARLQTTSSGIDVTGSIVASTTATIETGLNLESGTFTIKNATGDSNGLKISQESSDESRIYNHYNGSLTFGISNSEKMRLNATGLGIGTTSPEEKLHVAGNILLDDADPRLYFQTGSSHYNWKIAAQDSTNKGFEISSGEADGDANSDTYTPRIVIEADTGDVGIGTDNPSRRLYVKEAVGGPVVEIEGQKGSSFPLGLGVDNTGGFIQQTGDAPVFFYINSAERLRITGDGKVGIGATSPTATLEVKSSSEARHFEVDALAGFAGSTSSSLDSMVRFYNDGDGNNVKIQTNNAAREDAYLLSVWATTNPRFVIENAGNTGIGTASPSAPLVVSNGGAAGMEFHPELTTDTNRLTNYDRTASAYMNFKLDALTQQFNISGSEIMRLTSTGLGIGTTSPAHKIHIASGSTNVGIQTISTDAGAYMGFEDNSTGNTGSNSNVYVGANGDNFVVFTGASERARFNSTGLGIGTTSPDNKLHVQTAALSGRSASNGNTLLTLEHSTDTGIQFFSATQTQLRFGDAASTGAGSIIYTHSDNILRFEASSAQRFTIGGSEKMRIDSSGNVGIGTSSPSFTSGSGLEISRAGVATLRLEDTDGTTGATELVQVDADGYLLTRQSGALIFGVNSSEKMRLDSSGRFMVGQTSASSNFEATEGGAKFVLRDGSGYPHFYQSGGSAQIGFSRTSNSQGTGYIGADSANVFAVWDSSFNREFIISQSGNGTIVGNMTAYGSTSDIRLKENIATIENPLDKVLKLRGVTFNYKEDGSKSTGLIAQELEKVLPEVVYETEDINDPDNKFLAVRYGNVVGLLVEAIKELKAEIEELKKDSHPPKGLHDLDGSKDLLERIKKLEEKYA